jgi:hypothetical protein
MFILKVKPSGGNLVTETVYQLVKKTTTAHCPKGKID